MSRCKSGNSLGVIRPNKLLGKFRVEKDNELFFIDTPDGFSITSHNEEFERQMKRVFIMLDVAAGNL